MEYRQLGGSGFKVPVLSLGTGTFGGGNEFFKAWGASDVAEATRLVDICLEAGLTMFDSADVYSNGMAEEILGQAIKGRRDKVLISTKGTFPRGAGPQRRRLFAPPPDPGGRGEPAAPRHRLHRPLPIARLRRGDAGRRSAGYAGRPGARRQDPLRRLLEFLRLAPDEIAGGLGEARPRALRRPPGLLLAGRARLRMGTDAAGARPEGRRGGVESARLGTPHRQDPPRAADAASEPAAEQARLRHGPAGAGRISLSRGGCPRCGRRRKPARAFRRSPSTGCCSARRWRRSSRRAQRGAAAAESGRGRLEPHAGADRQTGRRQRRAPPYPYWHQRGTFIDRNPAPV